MAVTRSDREGSAAGRGAGRGRGAAVSGRGAGRGTPVVEEVAHVEAVAVEEAPAWARQMQMTISRLVDKVATLEDERNQSTAAAATPVVTAPSREGFVQVAPPPPAGQSPAMMLAMQETWMRMAERFQKMNPPTFSGSADPMDADKWIDDMKVILTFLRTDQIQSRRLAAICLKGDANKWWQKSHSVEEEETLTWDEFLERFEQQYIAEVVRANKEEELNNLKQGDMTITEYENKFISLYHFAKDLHLTDAALGRRFEKGLNDEYRVVVKSQMRSTLKEVVNAARAIEDDINLARKRKKDEAFKAAGKRSTPDAAKDKQGEQPKRQNDRWDPEVKRQRRESGACFRCGEQGHKIADCPNQRGQGNGAKGQGGAQGAQVNALVEENVLQIGGNRYAFVPGLPQRNN